MAHSLATGILKNTNPHLILASVIVAARKISGEELMDPFIQELVAGIDKEEFIMNANQAKKRIERVCLTSSRASEWKELYSCSDINILQISSKIIASLCPKIEKDYLN